MSGFARAGVRIQHESASIAEADRNFKKSCRICASHGFSCGACDRCPIAAAHAFVVETFGLVQSIEVGKPDACRLVRVR